MCFSLWLHMRMGMSVVCAVLALYIPLDLDVLGLLLLVLGPDFGLAREDVALEVLNGAFSDCMR